MGFAIVLMAGVAGLASILIIGNQTGAFAGHGAPIPSQPTSPLDEAERIVAHRYARGDITPEEYTRMLAILRR